MNRILLRGVGAFVLLWIALQFYSLGESHTLDQIIYVLIVLTNVAVVAHMFWDRRLRIWGAGSVAILLGAAGWAALFGWFLIRVFVHITPGTSEGWLDAVRALVIIYGPLLIYAMIRFRLDKKRRGEAVVPGELLTEGLHERRQTVRRQVDKDRDARLDYLEAKVAEYEQG